MGSKVELIPTITLVTIYTLYLEIFTYYYSTGEEIKPLLNQFWISNTTGYILGTPFIEGYGLALLRDYPYEIFPYVDKNGDLIIISEDCNNYSIDENGDVIYTY